jgi:tetratricopeptide (TPR) repeat protein
VAYERAGNLFLRAAEAGGPDLARILREGAVMFERASLPRRAAQVYERILELPDVPFAVEARFRHAYNLARAFEWDEALDAYGDLLHDPRSSGHPLATDATLNSALLLEWLGRPEPAARMYRRWADLARDEAGSEEALFRAGQLTAERGARALALRDYEAFLLRVRMNDPKMASMAEEAERRIEDLRTGRPRRGRRPLEGRTSLAVDALAPWLAP